jgi:hypothetical protein
MIEKIFKHKMRHNYMENKRGKFLFNLGVFYNKKEFNIKKDKSLSKSYQLNLNSMIII